MSSDRVGLLVHLDPSLCFVICNLSQLNASNGEINFKQVGLDLESFIDVKVSLND